MGFLLVDLVSVRVAGCLSGNFSVAFRRPRGEVKQRVHPTRECIGMQMLPPDLVDLNGRSGNPQGKFRALEPLIFLAPTEQ